MNQEINSKSSLLLEIGTEDIPARFLPIAIQQLNVNTESIFRENHIIFFSTETYGSPRRLAVIVEGINPLQEDRSREVFGPPKKVAFDSDGKPTKASIGFANSQGVSVDKLIVKTKDKGEYIVAAIEEKGNQVKEILPDILKKVVLSIHLPKSMRWGNGDIRFVRPIRWLLALFDKDTISFEIDGIKSSNATRGHRFLSPASFQIKEIPSYIKLLANNYVIVDQGEREKIISEKIAKVAASVGGVPVKDEKLLETVTHLVEYPVPVLGSFSSEYLKLPKELLITVMREHQKYFAIETSQGKLTNYFIVISNTDKENLETVKIGAERVIKARFEDARFYFEEDSKKRLDERIDDLKNVTFQDKLGSLYDKVARIRNLVLYLSSKINPSLSQKAERAALLSKTDLITGAVREFPELQGIMGRYYAIYDKEDTEVADALMEQYLPAYHGDKLSKTEVGTILSLADKIDNIASFFSIGLMPSGSEDPFALRRQTLAVISIMFDKGYKITLEEIISESLKNLRNTKRHVETRRIILQFFEQRLEPLFSSQGYDPNVVSSLISLSTVIPLEDLKKRLDAMQEFKIHTGYNDFLTAIKRVRKIIPEDKLPHIKVKLILEEPEKKLYERLTTLNIEIERSIKEHDYLNALKALSSLTEPINNFFDNVLVMDKKEEIKLNRLSLLKDIWKMALNIADFSKL
jgi:glycyl-tRNA synthetase beta chain